MECSAGRKRSSHVPACSWICRAVCNWAEANCMGNMEIGEDARVPLGENIASASKLISSAGNPSSWMAEMPSVVAWAPWYVLLVAGFFIVLSFLITRFLRRTPQQILQAYMSAAMFFSSLRSKIETLVIGRAPRSSWALCLFKLLSAENSRR